MDTSDKLEGHGPPCPPSEPLTRDSWEAELLERLVALNHERAVEVFRPASGESEMPAASLRSNGGVVP